MTTPPAASPAARHAPRTLTDLLPQHEPAPTIALSWGLGVDSTAILTRWLTDPSSRDFDLNDLVVITAMVGAEWVATGELAERHILPLLARHGVRTVSVARRGPSRKDGVVVLDDTRTPRALSLSGAYRLETDMLTAGTIPQSAGPRLCSQNFKGWPLDQALADFTAGRRYRHVLGYEANERARADRDARYNTVTRTGEYPLIAWGWDRATCEQFLADTFGAVWPKSACWCSAPTLCRTGSPANVSSTAMPPTPLPRTGPCSWNTSRSPSTANRACSADGGSSSSLPPGRTCGT